jgi:hypothetical protein
MPTYPIVPIAVPVKIEEIPCNPADLGEGCVQHPLVVK